MIDKLGRDLSEANPDQADLISCDAEPIHVPGSIQPHGVLLALHPVSNVVSQVAGDTRGLLGAWLQDVLGRPAGELLGDEPLERLLASLPRGEPTDRSLPISHALVTPAGRQLSAIAYESAGIAVIELEPAGERDASRVVTLLQGMQRELLGTHPLPDLCQRVAANIRAATGFDRVMVYRFLPDGSGVVEAEVRDAAMEPFLGLHYPASDIPRQARALYLRRWLRLIPDARYTPAPLLPVLNPSSGKPLDMEHSLLRSVSPIHLEYLANMSVAASMSVSLVVNGQLWGLIACHHNSVRHVTPDVRIACELFAELISLRLASDAFQQSIDDRRAAGMIVDRLIRGLVREPDLGPGLTALNPNLLDLLPASGATLWFGGRADSVGQVPTPQQIAGIVAWLERQQDQIIITDRLPALHPAASKFADVASGLLAVSLSQERGAYVLWYLPEFVHSISWGGDPSKVVTTGPHGARLTPRGSFELWKEEVFQRSRPWIQAEIEAATALRMVLLDVVLRQMAKAAADREKASRQQDLLMAELDHRVKNMLATIQALARQSLAGETSLEGFRQSFQGRLQAMSRAHNVLTKSRWESVDLRNLIDEELEPYQSNSGSQIVLRANIEVALRPKAALAVCLAIHELATNAGKYGALSVPGGRLDVDWDVTPGPESVLKLTWRESGGPPVSKPTRTGFGFKLITTSLAYEIDGAVDMAFPVEGLTCDITIPIDMLVIPDRAPAIRSHIAMQGRRGIEGARVLLVEDNGMITIEVVDGLNEMGALVVGPAARVPAAMRLIEAEPIDVAVLDIDLNGTKVWPVADELARRGVPFCFASGYDPGLVVPPKLRDRQMLNKPYTIANLEAMLKQLLGH